MRMEQHSVLEAQGKCANSCLHEYSYIIHSVENYTK